MLLQEAKLNRVQTEPGDGRQEIWDPDPSRLAVPLSHSHSTQPAALIPPAEPSKGTATSRVLPAAMPNAPESVSGFVSHVGVSTCVTPLSSP